MRLPRLYLAVLQLVLGGLADVAAAVIEQVGTAIVPTPKSFSTSSATVPVFFEVPFHTTPKVVATPFFHAYDAAAGVQTFVASVFDVSPTGFSLYVERLDQYSWYGGRVLVSWIAWDSGSLSSGASGSVAVVPSTEENGFASNVVLEFPNSPFTTAPAVIATVRLAEGAPLGFAVTVSEATASFAVLNLAVVGSPKAWTSTSLVHVDWRAWPVGVANLPQTHNYEAHIVSLRPCEASNGCIETLHEPVAMSRVYPYDPVILLTVMNGPITNTAQRAGNRGGTRGLGQQKDASSQDTFVASVHNITNRQFEVNVAKVYGSVTQGWKEILQLAWIARNASKVCPDDCMGHGVCIDSTCHCDRGWAGNGTCDTCDWGYWGPGCEPCTAYNETLHQVCEGHGVCDGSGTTTGTGQCSCYRGYNGSDCGSCVEGFYQDLVTGACSLCPASNNVTCSGHGQCKWQKVNGSEGEMTVGYCACEGEYAGAYCAECVSGYGGEDCTDQCPLLCSNRGRCDVTGDGHTKAYSCQCTKGWDDAAFCADCAAGFFGPDCMGLCRDCGPHGGCNGGVTGDGNCTCLAGYTGTACDMCDYGYSRAPGKDVCLECPGGHDNPCSGNSVVGGCTEGRCICAPGYRGEDCSVIIKQGWWATALIIVLAAALFLALLGLAVRFYGGMRKRRRASSKGGNSKELDPELRKRLLEQCPELAGLEDALSAMGSDAADWLIDFNKLELGYRIGSGTSSVVFRGLCFGEVVAIKKLQSGKCDPSLFALFFRQEAELLSKLHHPHVIRFYGVCYHEGDFYIVTELCENTLQRIVTAQRQEGKRTPREDMYRIACQIANGMAYLHSKHVVHRDLKPENVLIDDRGDVKICDFGLSRLISTDSQMTVQVGTPAFMAPEMADGANMSESVDVYSFGVLLWCLATSQNPYFNLDVTPVQLLSRVVAGLRPHIDESIPKPLAQMMRVCWDRDPGQRPTFEGLVRELRGLLREEQRRRHFVSFSPSVVGGSSSSVASAQDADVTPLRGGAAQEASDEDDGGDGWAL